MMDVSAKNFYSYFLNCFLADHKAFSVDNLLSPKFKFKWFGQGQEQLINSNYPKITYDNKKIDELEKDLELYKLEKSLFYCSFFITGRNNNPLTKDKRLCAPLLLYPADISYKDEQHYLSIRKDELILNKSVISLLEEKPGSLSKTDFFNELTEKVQSLTDNAIGLKYLFESNFKNIDCNSLSLFPSIEKINTLKKRINTNSNNYQLISACGTVLIENTASTLHIANDLEEIIKANQFNNSLKELLSQKPSYDDEKKSKLRYRLNPEQHQVLRNTFQYSNTILIGPPGTGKSYTIANIVADAVVRNRSVLVVSKTKQAVEVIREMLWESFGLKDSIIHTSSPQYKSSLKGKLRRQLTGVKKRQGHSLNLLKVNELIESLERSQSLFESMVDKELSLSELSSQEELSLHEKWQKLLIHWKGKLDQRVWETFSRIQSTSEALQKELVKYPRRELDHRNLSLAPRIRKALSAYYDCITASNFSEYKRLLSKTDFSKVLKVLPVWLADLTLLNGVIPLEKEVFDLVIIDEATQCDIASALPAIYRAKKALVAGDPNQLKHYSFISRTHQNNLKTKFNIPEDKLFDYRDRSILDVFVSKVPDQNQVVFLREHFRSTPALVQFSNQSFYDNQLEIIKSTPNYTYHDHVKLIEVDGARNEHGINEAECTSLLNKLDEFITEFDSMKSPPSIGVIGMLGDQTNFIKSQIKSRYDLETIKRFQLLCGTPYQFQGSEREIVLISLAITNSCHHSAIRHLNSPEVLNVGITRARSQQFVFSSLKSHSKNEGLIGEYLAFIQSFNHKDQSDLSQDEFQKDVIHELKQFNVDAIYRGYPVAGSILDILVVHQGSNFFIDLIGFPGIFQEAFSLERYRTLGNAGIKSLPLHYSFWKKNRNACIAQLSMFLNL